MDCKCKALAKKDQIPSQGMDVYAEEHLKKVSVDSVAWEIIYQCPKTDIKFLRKNIHTELHGGGYPIWSFLTEE